MKKQKEENYLTQAPEEEAFTIENDGKFPNLKNYPGDSVDEHERQETANALIAEGELGQQNENL